jgi:metal-dependent amidase/aminoacylase/carboxypeptidase family protein
MIAVLDELASVSWPISAKLGQSTYHVGKLEGGVAYNVIAASSSALCAVRVAADLEGIKSKIEEIVSRHPKITLKYNFQYPATMLDHDVEGMNIEQDSTFVVY